ncbi:glycosyltransferase family A protein [Ammoniphilus sp. YIM 78166]|uniref:glycosyltransferase family 2 protein n=1 Tax=Ammoniphilus sp. YIM 78166 TaxID=1644106 RepID=UPI00106F88D7|nr:glycosyltransferase family A protein [Ammoniphilus sp. YIM 78166]
MTKAKFTVVIPSYNRAEFIEQAIESVLEQTYDKWKLLIIDDASTDDTVKKVEPYLKDERIRLVCLDRNQGISSVLNRALEEVDTEAFVQLDSDDWLDSDALRRFSKAMKEDPSAALYYGNVRMWAQRSSGKWKVIKRVRHRKFDNKYQFLCYMTYMLHPRCYRTEAVREVGGWETDDPYGGRIMEDRRMVLKLIERYPLHWINKTLYNRRKHRLQLTKKEDFQMRNQLRKELVSRSLSNWGNEYSPVFGYRGGLLIVKRLLHRKKSKMIQVREAQ